MPSNYTNYFLFLFSPILALANSLANWRSADCRNVVWFFAAFYGMAFYIHPESESDSVQYRAWFIEMHQSDLSFETLQGSFYREEERYYDLYQPLLTFFLSRFTDNERVFFAVTGFVFGYFYSRLIFFFILKLKPSAGWLELWLAVSLAFVLDMGSGINGIRMYTGLYVFLLGSVYYWERRQPLHFLLAAASILVHFSYVIPVAILLAANNHRPFLTAIYCFFLASFIMNTIDVSFVRDFVDFLPLGVETRVAGYLNEFDPSFHETPRILLINTWSMHIFSICSATTLFLTTRRMRDDSFFAQALIFTMYLYGVTNILSEVGSIGRFYIPCQIILIGLLLILLTQYDRIPAIRQTGIAMACLLVLNTALSIRFMLGFASINLLVGNPITIWFFDFADRALYDWLPPILRGL